MAKTRRSKYVKQKLIEMKGEIDPQLYMETLTFPQESVEQVDSKLTKYLGDLNTVNQLDLIDILE